MHDVANVKGKDPVVCVVILDAEGASGCNFELLLHLQFVHLFERLEGDLKFLLLSHPILEEITPFSKVKLRNLRELFLDADEF